MSEASLTFNIDVSSALKFAQIADKVAGGGLFKVALTTAAIAVQGIERGQAPVKTGRLVNSIKYKVSGMKAEIGPAVGYGIYVEMGTGLYGPKGQLITPKNSKVFASKSNPGFGTKSKGGYYIIGRSIKGQHPNPFMERSSVLAMPVVTEIFKMVPAGVNKVFKEVERV